MTPGPTGPTGPTGPIGRRRRPGPGRLLLAGVLLMPVVEIGVAIAVAGQIGTGRTVLALVVLSVIGIVVLRRTARAAFSALGPVPGTPVGSPAGPAGSPAMSGASSARGADLALEAAGGVLLALPGFVSAAFGALLVLPPVRRLLRPLLGAGAARLVRSAMRRGQVRVVGGEVVGGEMIDVEVVDVEVLRDAEDGVRDAGPGRRPALPGEVVRPDEP